MFHTDLYQQVLGVTAPWKVTDVRLDVESTEIQLHVEHAEGCRWSGPQPSRQLACYDHSPERQWRHLNSCQFHTLVHARVPRVGCAEHGVLRARVPRAEPHSCLTLPGPSTRTCDTCCRSAWRAGLGGSSLSGKVGDAEPTGANQGGGRHDRSSIRQQHHSLAASTDQRSRRRPQQQDHGHPATSGRLSERRDLQERDLLLLRRFTALPMKVPDGPGT